MLNAVPPPNPIVVIGRVRDKYQESDLTDAGSLTLDYLALLSAPSLYQSEATTRMG